jgi:Ca-activated chloride channel homolog
MRRWQFTLGLTGLAIVAAALAPRLLTKPTPQDPKPVPPPPPEVPLEVPEISEAPTLPAGHLIVEAGLDQTAVLRGQDNDRFLAVSVTAPEDIGKSFRRNLALSVVLDASGSMSARGKIDYAKHAAKLLADSMEANDIYSLVVFNDGASTIVPPTEVENAAAIKRAIDRVYEGGGTNLYAGLQEAGTLMQGSLQDNMVGRVILLSDGLVTVGVDDPNTIAKLAAKMASQGMTVSTVGLGLDYNEDLLARISDIGGGEYDFVDDAQELSSVFSDELRRSASVVARGTRVTIDLPDGVEGLEVIGWDAEQTASGDWTVWMGDIYAGETRKIIARVRVTGDGADNQRVASVHADYLDIVDDVTAQAWGHANAEFTTDQSRVIASIDNHRSVEANRAYGNWYLDMSTRAYAGGDVDKAKDLAQNGERVLIEAANNFDAPALAEEAEDLNTQQQLYESYKPKSAEGKRAVKHGKEMFRGRAR